jgi:hypothetical protein
MKLKRHRITEIVQSNRTIMAVGRERCNLNKSYTVSCIQNNRQMYSSKEHKLSHLCEGDSKAVLTENSIFSSYI